MTRHKNEPKLYENIQDIALHYIRARPYSFWVKWALRLGLGSCVVSLFVLYMTGQGCVLDSPGTIFSLVTGIATLFGLALAIGFLRESLYISRILTFRDLTREVSMLIKDASRNKALLKIVCFTPAIGNVSYPEDFARVKRTLNETEKLDFIQMVCLDRIKLKKFYDRYATVNPQLYSQSEVGKAYQEAEAIIARINEDRGQAIRKGIDKLPMFHILFTAKRGIVYLPLADYVYLFNTESSPTPVMLVQPKTTKRVEILGFVTEEEPLLDRFEECFNFYRDKLM